MLRRMPQSSFLGSVAPPKQYNPNLVPIGHGFGFIVFMLRVCAVIAKQLAPLTNGKNHATMQLTNVS